MIRVGTAGWHYDDWNGTVYPKPRPAGFDTLQEIARLFDTVEVNVTFYRSPAPEMAAGWAARAAAVNPSFRFSVKLPRAFTHGRADPVDETLENEEGFFRAAIEPLRQAGVLGPVLAQFPQSFHPGPDAGARLVEVMDRFADFELAIEFRHAGWDTPETLDLLKERRAAFCNIDQPSLASTLPPTAHVTAGFAYVRLHGRNSADWFRSDAGRNRRYDYLYGKEEVDAWVGRIRTIAGQTADVTVITNNHFRGKAAINALEIRAALEGGLVEVPDTLLLTHPDLASIAKPAEGRLPF